MGECDKLCTLILLMVKLYHGEAVDVEKWWMGLEGSEKEWEILNLCNNLCIMYGIGSD